MVKKLLAMQMPFSYVAGGATVVLLAAGVGGYGDYTIRSELTHMKQDFASSSAAFTAQITDLNGRLEAAAHENSNLYSSLQAEADRNNAYGTQVESLASTVAMLDKLSKTDRELLQKYSNVYFLSENFVPSPLAGVDPQYLFYTEEIQIHGHVKPHLEALLKAAHDDGIPLLVLSGYQSFEVQKIVKSNHKLTYGSGANKFSADQGYSEHQLGSTVDFTTKQGGSNLDVFEKSSASPWLEAHAHEYGFILSYPKGNKFFIYEPWHWRYVGVELATKLHSEGKHFYDLDQREINTYLVKIFD